MERASQISDGESVLLPEREHDEVLRIGETGLVQGVAVGPGRSAGRCVQREAQLLVKLEDGEHGQSIAHNWVVRNALSMDEQGTLSTTAPARSTWGRTLTRCVLGGFLLFAGTSHLTVARAEFQAQVPPWIPLDPDVVVLASGVVELGLGAALLVAPRALRPVVGWVTAAFFVAIFPGNLSQYLTRTDAFGLTTDTARFVRLFFQPVLVALALWSTGAWAAWRGGRTS